MRRIVLLSLAALLACKGGDGATGAQGSTGAVGATGPAGSMGPQGPPGPAGAPGARGMSWRGSWSPLDTYFVDDAVEYGGSAYMAVAISTGTAPPSSTWQLLAARGADGAPGPAGPKGLNWMGAWSPAVSYSAEDVVQLNGSSWVAVAPPILALPPPDARWELLAAAGAVGPAGMDGAQGPAGPTGAQGPVGPAGPMGPAGPQGIPGGQGAAGQSVTSVVLPVGDPNCPYGGTQFSTASGLGYACSGYQGNSGGGTLTSCSSGQANLAVDPDNCGTCGHVCDSKMCVGGQCEIVMFLTSVKYAGSALGGVAGADAKCQYHAGLAGLHNTYKAWIADGAATAPVSRLNRPTLPFVRVNGAIVANSWSDLLGGSLINSFSDEAGGSYSEVLVSSVPYVSVAFWSGTSSGFATSATCSGWTPQGGSGFAGRIYFGAPAVLQDGSAQVPCGYALSLLCLEQ